MSTLVDRFLEFHDTDLLAIVCVEGAVRVHLNAYVQQWERVGDSQSGTGWVQPCVLEFERAIVDFVPSVLPVRLADGTLHGPSEEGLDGTLTLPSTIAGACSLELVTERSERIRIEASALRVATCGEARQIETLPDDLAPDT